jgi:hypothetical protein
MGLEVVVRPTVFPNIRPAPPRRLAPEDSPEQGIAVISGSGGKLINLQHSFSVSMSRQKPHKETKRQFDEEKVYQTEKDKDEQEQINKDNYIRVERLKRVAYQTEQDLIRMNYADPPQRDNVEVIRKDVTRLSTGGEAQR